MQKRINTLQHANEEQDLRSLEIKKDEPVKDDEPLTINIVGTGKFPTYKVDNIISHQQSGLLKQQESHSRTLIVTNHPSKDSLHSTQT